jgi:hypothetical protein
MTSDRLAGRSLSTDVLLVICDRLLGEVGRRRHMFAWLRAPNSSTGEWLAVDAYYPRSRLVVIVRTEPGEHDALYRELVPAHGLGLLTLNPAGLARDPDAVETALAAKIFDVQHLPRHPAPPGAPRPREAPPAQAEDKAPEWTPVKVARTPAGPALQQSVGVLVGLVLAAALVVELYLAVIKVAFDAGRVLLAFAIAFEACSRVLGTVAAERAGRRGWACACAIGGAPIVAWFVLRSWAERAEREPAPLAGLLALLAGLLALLGVLVGS